MDDKSNEFWKNVSPLYRQYQHLAPPTRAEAEAAMVAASAAPLSEQRLEDILAFALTGKKPKRKLSDLVPDWLKNIDLNHVNQEMVLALARNAGATDDEVEEVLKQLRREAFEEDGENGEQESGV